MTKESILFTICNILFGCISAGTIVNLYHKNRAKALVIKEQEQVTLRQNKVLEKYNIYCKKNENISTEVNSVAANLKKSNLTAKTIDEYLMRLNAIYE